MATASSTNCSPRVLRICACTSRAIAAAGGKANANAGKNTLRNPSMGSSVIGTEPLNGSRSSSTPIIKMKINPTRNGGVPSKTLLNESTIAETYRLRADPATTPSVAPMISMKMRATTASSTVVASLDEISSETGRPLRIEVPKSPLATSFTQSKYCAIRFSSKPSSDRIASICSSVASGPARVTAGSPGASLGRLKPTNDATTNTSTTEGILRSR